jgi:hypothetical protein
MAQGPVLCDTARMRPTGTSRYRSAGRGGALLWTLVLGMRGRSVHAADNGALELDWQAPAQCADAAELESQVYARLPERRPARAPLRARGRIEATQAGYRLELQTEQGRRTLLAQDCEELVSAAALMLALLVDSQARNEPQPTATVPPPRAIWALIRPELEADLGTLPHLAIGPGLSAGVRVYATSLEVSGYYLPSQNVSGPQQTATLGELHALGAGLGACQGVTSPIELSPCLRLEYGRIEGHGTNLRTSAYKADAPWVLALLGVRVSAELLQRLHGVLELAIGLPLLGATFTVNPVGTVHQTGDMVGRLRAGIELRL